MESRRGSETSRAPAHALDPRELEDAERLADRVHPAVRREQRLEPLDGQAEHLDVPVLERQLEQRVAHGAAHEERPAARLAQRREQARETGRQLEPHRGAD